MKEISLADIMSTTGLVLTAVGIAIWFEWPAAAIFAGVCLLGLGLWGELHASPPQRGR